MKFEIFRTSYETPNVGETNIKISKWKWDNKYEIEVNTLEELMDIINKANTNIIVSEASIEIYDSWRE